MTEQNISILWPDWTVEERIGSGGFGAVYRVSRRLPDGTVEYAAIKVIHIPSNPDDVAEWRSEGYDDAAIRYRLEESRQAILQEYAMMVRLKGHSNVVYCEDHRSLPAPDGFGWSIFIKMELLTPLMQYLPQMTSERQIIRLGMDLCNLLEVCRKENILHRDIKPQNIFVSVDGTFKLGDFGVAKSVERITSGSKVGTYKYMAPEVFNNQPYGPSVDLYSLGLVLYWLLNEKRGPFLPPMPSFQAEEHAKDRRFAGEPIPPPAHGSPELRDIVLRACAFRPEDRFASPAEMEQALFRLDTPEHDIPIPSGSITAAPAAFTPLGLSVSATTPVIYARPDRGNTGSRTPNPVRTGNPAGFPAQGGIPVNTASRTPIPGNTANRTPIPGNTANRTPIPGNTANRTPVPGNTANRTPVPGNTANRTPVPGNTANRTPIPGNTADRTPIPVYTANPAAAVPADSGAVSPPFRAPIPVETAAAGAEAPGRSRRGLLFLLLGLLLVGGAAAFLLLSGGGSSAPPAIQLDWTEWAEALPDFVSEEGYEIQHRTLWRSRSREFSTSESEEVPEGWELYETLPGNGEFGPWTDWDLAEPEEDPDREVESELRYRVSNLETTTGASEQMEGWELYDTTYTYGPYPDWTDSWSEEPVTANDRTEVQTELRYRSSRLETTTGSSQQMAGWELYDTTYTYNDPPWPDTWSTTPVTQTDTVKVQTRTEYSYQDSTTQEVLSGWSAPGDWTTTPEQTDGKHKKEYERAQFWGYCYYRCPSCGTSMPTSGTCEITYGGCGGSISGSNMVIHWDRTSWDQQGLSSWYGTGYQFCYIGGERYFVWSGHGNVTRYRYCTQTVSTTTVPGPWSSWSPNQPAAAANRTIQKRTVYRSRTLTKTPTYHFRRWGDWSDWSTTPVTASSTVKTETGTFYRSRTREATPTYHFRRWSDFGDWTPEQTHADDTHRVETETFYRYRDKVYTPTYCFRRWGEWSDWSETPAEPEEDLEVETAEQTRYRSKQG